MTTVADLAFTRRKSPLGTEYVVTNPDTGDILGVVARRRSQSQRTYATGWRWFYGCRVGHADHREHGFETRRQAAVALLRHAIEWKEVAA